MNRTARLFGDKGNPGTGGLLLPEIFREILSVLCNEGPRSTEELHRIVREMIPYKSERVLDRWGSWERFGDELLDILSDGKYISWNGSTWEITAKAVPGEMLTVFRDPDDHRKRIRVTFTSRDKRQAADAIAEAWRKTGELARFLEARSSLSPVLLRAWQKSAGISEILQEAMHNPEPAFVPEGRGPHRHDGRPRNSGQADWYRQWIPTAGWHTQDVARRAWNDQFPDRQLASVSESSFRNISRKMVGEGTMETRLVGNRIDGRSCATEYRIISQSQR